MFHFVVFLVHTGVQSDLDVKMKELQSKSGSVTTLGQWWPSVISKQLKQAIKEVTDNKKMSLLSALQVSTLTTQVEALKRQVQDSSSEVIIKGVFSFHVWKSSCPGALTKHFYLVHFSWPQENSFMLAKEALKDQRVSGNSETCIHLMLKSLSDLPFFSKHTDAEVSNQRA